MKGFRKYYGQKILWYLLTLVFAVILNFVLPRLMPGDPVAAIASKQLGGNETASQIQQIYAEYNAKFGTDKPMWQQFFIWLGNLFHGDLGVSFSQYPRTVSNIIHSAVGWTIALQLPAILVGWILGNLLGAVAAYKRGAWDKVVLPISMFISNIPAFGMAVILLFIFAKSVMAHYQLPFWSIVLTTIGGQAIGMRSMSIYELNADYVKYSRFLGIKDRKIVGYVFHNAMLPQITGLALSLGTMIGGALVAEMIFSYPGLGTTILQATTGQDYPLLSACTLIITIMVLVACFVVEILYGVIDPRVKANQQDS